VLVAVSGGADSTALLRALHRLAPELGYRLVAAHLHHGLRGMEADDDLGFVRALCERLEVTLVSARWNTRERMRRRRLSGQDGLRRLRREFLERVARRSGASAIATAHTADDQLETLLLRLGRGTGLVGLGGIAMRRGGWIRPLLEASRAEIEADLACNDNTGGGSTRITTELRHEVVPPAWAQLENSEAWLELCRLDRQSHGGRRQALLAKRPRNATSPGEWAIAFRRHACRSLVTGRLVRGSRPGRPVATSTDSWNCISDATARSTRSRRASQRTVPRIRRSGSSGPH
jgi:tRNA(Ile)-lysidine synthetase-like protein